jgi:hypothetical protein
MSIMRTTLAINDELLGAAKRRARERGISLGQLVDGALQRELATGQQPTPGPEVPVFTRGTGPQPGVDLRSNRALVEFLDEGLPFEKLR